MYDKSTIINMMNSKNLMTECTFLINPTRHPSSAKVLKKILKKKTDARIVESSSIENFRKEVRSFCTGDSKYLVIWGGDGTVHQAINAMMGKYKPIKALGFLRGGTGNGIQDSYEIPHFLTKQINTYIDSVKNSYIESVDLLRIDIGSKTVYGQLLGIGYDAEVLKLRKSLFFKDAQNTVRPGMRYYLFSALKLFRKLDFRNTTEIELTFKSGKYALKGIKINAEYPFKTLIRKTKAVIIEIGTRPYYGSLFRICPDVVCNDGNMDAYLYQFNNHLTVLLNLISIWNGWHHRINARLEKMRQPLIERYEIKETIIKTGKNVDFHIDGELFNTGDTDEIHISIIPQAINFLVPGSFYHKFHPFENKT